MPAGTFAMGDPHGDGHPADGETPVHPVALDAFTIDATAVTNGMFSTFVSETGYVTDAERHGTSAVFHLAFDGQDEDVVGRPPESPWWLGVRGADWRHPGGLGSSLQGLADHPVTHVSWHDAQAYCSWGGRRLPTEAEWECASRGGLDGMRYPWGDGAPYAPWWRCNIWQGAFPSRNTGDDGYVLTAPVRSYAPNGLGLWQTVGNVWEWCADWFARDYYSWSPRHAPAGPVVGDTRVIRGGSYLCHDSYCNRYRNAARSSNTPDSSTGNCGFRTVAAGSVR